MSYSARFVQYAVLLIGLLSLGCKSPPPALAAYSEQSHVVLVSFDGFRSDYPERWQLPAFLAMGAEGSRSRGLVPAYPSKTFPNHYSIVTGLYPGTHGLIDNNFHDPVRQLPYRMNDRQAVEDAQFYGGKPLWQHVQDYGKRSASYFWVGSEAPIAGRYPDYYRLYDGSVANDMRIAQVIDWLRLPREERPVFVSLYFSLVDSAAHTHGPLAEATRLAAVEADRLLGQLLSELQALPLRTNVVVVSDHGMVPVLDAAASYIHIPQLAEIEAEATVVYNQTQVLIYPQDMTRVPALKARLEQMPGPFSVYDRETLPAAWHYNRHANVPALLLAAQPGRMFSPSPAASRSFTQQVEGVHGYAASSLPELHGILLAKGPDIRIGQVLDAVENVHIFPFLCALLGLPVPAEIDGDLAVLAPLLRNPP